MYNKRSNSSDNAFYNRDNESTCSDDSYFARTDNFRKWQTPNQNQTSYVFEPYSSPYVSGKKNNSFFNPSLSSNDVFYDHNYGYVNDFPNERLLSPVKNDRFGESIRRKKASVDHQAESSRWKRDTDNELRPNSRQNYFLSRDYVAEPESQRRRAQLKSADGLPSTSRRELSNSRTLIQQQQQQSGYDEKTPVSVQRDYVAEPESQRRRTQLRSVDGHDLSNSRILIQQQQGGNDEKAPVYYIPRKQRDFSAEPESQRRRTQLRSADGLTPTSRHDLSNSRILRQQQEDEKTPVHIPRTNSVRAEPESQKRMIQLKSADGLQELSNSRIQDEKTPVGYIPRKVSTNSVNSFVQSELSTNANNYLCTNCLNHHLCGDAKARCAYEKQRDRLEELNVLGLSKQKQEKEDLVKRLLKAKKVAETRKSGEKIEQSYQEKLENRRSPPRTLNETEFKKIFDAHDHRGHMRRVMSSTFSNHLLDQMDDNQAAKRAQKLADSQFYNTSLQVKGINYNKYLDDPETVLSVLKGQVKQRASQKKWEKECDVRMGQELIQRDLELQEEEYYRQQDEKYQRNQELQESLHKLARDKKNKQNEEKARKTAERFHADKGYARHKKILEEQRQVKKAHAFDLQQEIKRQQVDNSYKKQYEIRKQQKTLTSFDPKPRIKNLLPCGDCNNLYEKAYMTKFYNS